MTNKPTYPDELKYGQCFEVPLPSHSLWAMLKLWWTRKTGFRLCAVMSVTQTAPGVFTTPTIVLHKDEFGRPGDPIE